MAKLVLLLVACIFDGVNAFGSVPDVGTKTATQQVRSVCQDIFFDENNQRTNPLNPFQQTPQTGLCLDVELNIRDFDVRAGIEAERAWCGSRSVDDCESSYATKGANGDLVACVLNDAKRCVADSERFACDWASPRTCESIYSGTVNAPVPSSHNFKDVCLGIATKDACNGYVFPVEKSPGAAFDEQTSNTFYSCGWATIDGNTACHIGGAMECKPRDQLTSRRRVQGSSGVCGEFTKDTCEDHYTYVGDDDEFTRDPVNHSPPRLAMCEWDSASGACIESTTNTCPYACEVMGINRGQSVPGRTETDLSLTFNDNVLEDQARCFAEWAHTQTQAACEEHFTTDLRTQAEIDEDIAAGNPGYQFKPIACRWGETSYGGGTCLRDNRANWGGHCV